VNPRLWLAYAILEVGLSLTPGPAVFTVIAQAVRHGARRSLYGNLGILSANLLYFALSALGVGAFLAASPRLYLVLRWGGIGYLAFTALRLLASHAGSLGAVRAADGTPRALFLQGFATHLGNPKAIVFYVSFLAPFLDTAAPWRPAAQIAAYAATTAAIEVPILVGYGVAAAQGTRLLPAGRLGLWQDRVAGGALLLVAAWLALR
jgi:homoserine/homoserine lactone efflux protein